MSLPSERSRWVPSTHKEHMSRLFPCPAAGAVYIAGYRRRKSRSHRGGFRRPPCRGQGTCRIRDHPATVAEGPCTASLLCWRGSSAKGGKHETRSRLVHGGKYPSLDEIQAATVTVASMFAAWLAPCAGPALPGCGGVPVAGRYLSRWAGTPRIVRVGPSTSSGPFALARCCPASWLI